MKIMHIVGNRPQFIKLAPISRELCKRGYEEVIVHTGQHYDKNMSDVFFQELAIPFPKVNLNVGSGTHAQVTANVMWRLEEVVVNERPSGVVIYGDTNSTLAAALVVSKLNIPLFHVEAGPRAYRKSNPEEQNRIVADHLSDYLFAPDKISAENLKREGIAIEHIIFSGDVMYDQFLYVASHSSDTLMDRYPDDFILLTWHRQENTYNKDRMERMLSFLEQLHYKIVFPIHPRTKKMLTKYELWERAKGNGNMILTEPVGYREMVKLLCKCRLLISDSGGVSKEASFAGKKCFFPLKLEVWPELIELGIINIVDIEDEISTLQSVKAIEDMLKSDKEVSVPDCFGNGRAAEMIVDIIDKALF